MKPTRRTQPYKGGTGPAGPTLAAMLMGRGKFLPNPQDAPRKATKMLNRRKRRRRKVGYSRTR